MPSTYLFMHKFWLIVFIWRMSSACLYVIRCNSKDIIVFKIVYNNIHHCILVCMLILKLINTIRKSHIWKQTYTYSKICFEKCHWKYVSQCPFSKGGICNIQIIDSWNKRVFYVINNYMIAMNGFFYILWLLYLIFSVYILVSWIEFLEFNVLPHFWIAKDGQEARVQT